MSDQKKMAEVSQMIDKFEEQTVALFEAFKLVMRLYVFSIVPTLGYFLLAGINITTGEITINWMIFKAIFLFETLTFILAGIDRYKHEYLSLVNEDPEKEGKSRGLVSF